MICLEKLERLEENVFILYAKMKNAKQGLFQENSRTLPGFLSNFPIFHDAFPGLKPIPELSRSFKDYTIIRIYHNSTIS